MERKSGGEQVQGDQIPQGVEIEPSKPVSGTDTVCVACKVQNGIIFELSEMIDFDEPVLGGGWKTVKKAQPTGERIVLRGPARDLQAMRRGVEPENPFAAGYALNPGIPREHWEKVAHDYRDHPALKERLVFATSDVLSSMSEARNLHGIVTGLEGIDPSNPGRRTGLPIMQGERPGASAA